MCCEHFYMNEKRTRFQFGENDDVQIMVMTTAIFLLFDFLYFFIHATFGICAIGVYDLD